eukprot:TRINITY_DN7194_c0_g1_i1.p1 TRINITY_DN7194_c0_g1~~TRINITY_DN7194_c0_g1_i1.p1  ORF type:complete len:210 (+),score=-16.12 TRINITY_DN7194_c0_g1_i1:457-1086(+)
MKQFIICLYMFSQQLQKQRKSQKCNQQNVRLQPFLLQRCCVPSLLLIQGNNNIKKMLIIIIYNYNQQSLSTSKLWQFSWVQCQLGLTLDQIIYVSVQSPRCARFMFVTQYVTLKQREKIPLAILNKISKTRGQKSQGNVLVQDFSSSKLKSTIQFQKNILSKPINQKPTLLQKIGSQQTYLINIIVTYFVLNLKYNLYQIIPTKYNSML